MHDTSRKRLIRILTDYSTDPNYTLEWREWMKRNLDRVRIGARLIGPDRAMRMNCILCDAAINYRYEKEMRVWARRTANAWKRRNGIRGW